MARIAQLLLVSSFSFFPGANLASAADKPSDAKKPALPENPAAVPAKASAPFSYPAKIEIPVVTDTVIEQYVNYTPATNAVSVQYIGLSGLQPQPFDAKNPLTQFVFDVSKTVPGTIYKFAAFFASDKGELGRVNFAVTVAKNAAPAKESKAPADLKRAVAEAIAKRDEALQIAKNAEALKQAHDLATAFQTLAHTVDNSGDGYTVAGLAFAIRTVRGSALGGKLPECYQFFEIESCGLGLPIRPTETLIREQKLAVVQLYKSYACLLEAIK